LSRCKRSENNPNQGREKTQRKDCGRLRVVLHPETERVRGGSYVNLGLPGRRGGLGESYLKYKILPKAKAEHIVQSTPNNQTVY